MKIVCTRTKSAGLAALSCGLLILSGLTGALSQTQGGVNGLSSSPGPSAFAAEANSSESSATEPASYTSTQSPFLSSVPEGKATGTVLPLSFKEAIDRALRTNLGLLVSSDNTLAIRGKKWEELSRLLPNISASANQSAQQIDLAALGFRFNFPGVAPVIGPIGTFDARVYLSAPLFDWHSIQRERGARANEVAARYRYNDAREMVVLAVGNEYLLSISAAARVDAAQAELETAQALFNKAH